MERTCARAVERGLRSVAFTDHADFTVWTVPADEASLPPYPAARPGQVRREIDVGEHLEVVPGADHADRLAQVLAHDVGRGLFGVAVGHPP
jgi:histidinol phosphatase-like PHP family hydrolase